LECRKIWIISFRLSTNINVHFKIIIYFLNVHFFNYFKTKSKAQTGKKTEGIESTITDSYRMSIGCAILHAAKDIACIFPLSLYTITNTVYAGAGTRVQRIFSKKTLTGPSQTRTCVPVYPPIPGHGYRGYTGTGCTRRILAIHYTASIFCTYFELSCHS
jgi:hypothetical protein